MTFAGRPTYRAGMDRRRFLLTSLAGVLAVPLGAKAQETGKVYRIGFLRAGQPPRTFVEGLQQGLRARGYIDGRNAAIENRTPGATSRD